MRASSPITHLTSKIADPDEGSSAALKEPMAASRALVASDLPGVSEVVGEAALLTRPGDPEALGSALATAIRDPVVRGRLIVRGQSRVERFRVERMVDGVLATYRSALEGVGA